MPRSHLLLNNTIDHTKGQGAFREYFRFWGRYSVTRVSASSYLEGVMFDSADRSLKSQYSNNPTKLLDNGITTSALMNIYTKFDCYVQKVTKTVTTRRNEFIYDIELSTGESLQMKFTKPDIAKIPRKFFVDSYNPREFLYGAKNVFRSKSEVTKDSDFKDFKALFEYAIDQLRAQEVANGAGQAIYEFIEVEVGSDGLREGEACVLDENAVAHPLRLGWREPDRD